MRRTYIAIDLKSYYASVECMERGLDPMTTNLVVADLSRTEKTICLAVSPSLKAYGISGRARLFEVVERVKEVNAERRRKAGGNLFEKSCDAHELRLTRRARWVILSHRRRWRNTFRSARRSTMSISNTSRPRTSTSTPSMR